MLFQVTFDRLAGNVRGQGSYGSGTKVTLVKVNVKGHLGLAQSKGHDISRWAHINVKLLHLSSVMVHFIELFILKYIY